MPHLETGLELLGGEGSCSVLGAVTRSTARLHVPAITQTHTRAHTVQGHAHKLHGSQSMPEKQHTGAAQHPCVERAAQDCQPTTAGGGAANRHDRTAARGTWSRVGQTYTLQHTYDRVLVKNCSRCWELADQVDTPRRSFSTRPFCSTATKQSEDSQREAAPTRGHMRPISTRSSDGCDETTEEVGAVERDQARIVRGT